MNYTHTESASGRWFEFSLAEQMGNIGSEVERYANWHKKGNKEKSEKAFYRAIELLCLTMMDPRWRKARRLKEIGRLREVLCDTVLNGSKLYNTPIDYFQNYFMQFAIVARNRTLASRAKSL